MPKLRPNIWHIPALLVVIMGTGLYFRSNSLWDSFEETNIRRKPRDIEFAMRSYDLAYSYGKPSMKEVIRDTNYLVEGLHKNTLTMAGLTEGTSIVEVQPGVKIPKLAIDAAKMIWANSLNQDELYENGIKFYHKGETYHLIARRNEIEGNSWSFAYLTNVSRSIQSAYNQSLHELSIVFSCLAITSFTSTVYVAKSIDKLTKAIPKREKIFVPWWWVSQAATLAATLNEAWERENVYKIQIEQSTSGHIIVRSPVDGGEATMHSPNAAFCKITGYTKEEIEGQPLNTIVPSEYHPYHYGNGLWDPAKRRNVGMLAYAKGCPFHSSGASEIVGSDRSVPIVHKDQSLRQAVLGVEEIGWSEDKSYWEWMGVVTDVSDLSKAKADAEKLAESEKALRLEFELLQQTWRHDLLSAVLGTDNMFKTLARIGFKVEDPRYKEAYDLAQAKASFAHRLVRDTRDLGVSLENLEKAPITLASLMASIKILYTEADITYSLKDEDQKVCINESSLVGRAISNLINNAIKFSGLNGIIEVGIRAKDDNAIIYVKDNGIGISEEGCKKVFSGVGSGVRMAQDIPGDGFGLHSAKGIVEAHGGTISVKSELGQGSVFFIKIPLVKR